ncbi:MAG: hypothetical protein CK528_15935 [Alcaligenaceae bacterium]|nr:MAG: hypothetical protein CK528_15935 [Alcaligenaceae bacterium]
MLLSICLPTYNRHEPLRELSEQFFSKVLGNFSTEVEIIICDDSNQDIATANQQVLHPSVRYRHNSVRAGFASSTEQCLEQALGKFVWLISDDDPIIWEGFEQVMLTLRQDAADCYLVPFSSTTFFNETRSEVFPWFPENRLMSISDMLTNHPSFLPFVLCSAGIVRLDKTVIKRVRLALQENLFIHIAMFFEMFGHSARVFALEIPVINFKLAASRPYDVVTLFDMRLEVLEYLAPTFPELKIGMPDQLHSALESSLYLWIEDNAGMVKMKPNPKARRTLQCYYKKYWKHKTLILRSLLVLPAVCSKVMYDYSVTSQYANTHNKHNKWLNRVVFMYQAYKMMRAYKKSITQ